MLGKMCICPLYSKNESKKNLTFRVATCTDIERKSSNKEISSDGGNQGCSHSKVISSNFLESICKKERDLHGAKIINNKIL